MEILLASVLLPSFSLLLKSFALISVRHPTFADAGFCSLLSLVSMQGAGTRFETSRAGEHKNRRGSMGNQSHPPSPGFGARLARTTSPRRRRRGTARSSDPSLTLPESGDKGSVGSALRVGLFSTAVTEVGSPADCRRGRQEAESSSPKHWGGEGGGEEGSGATGRGPSRPHRAG